MGDTRQQSIPVSRSKIKKELFTNWGLSVNELTKLQNLATMFEAIWHHDCHYVLEELKSLYEGMNPDTEEQIEMSDRSRFLEIF